MKIIANGHDPEQKGIYLCDCDCKGHRFTAETTEVTVIGKDTKDKTAEKEAA